MTVIPGYTAAMKTAISLPDDLFARAEQLAARRGVSRSQLYAEAIAHLLDADAASSAVDDIDAALRAANYRADGVATDGLARLAQLTEGDDW